MSIEDRELVDTDEHVETELICSININSEMAVQNDIENDIAIDEPELRLGQQVELPDDYPMLLFEEMRLDFQDLLDDQHQHSLLQVNQP